MKVCVNSKKSKRAALLENTGIAHLETSVHYTEATSMSLQKCLHLGLPLLSYLCFLNVLALLSLIQEHNSTQHVFHCIHYNYDVAIRILLQDLNLEDA